jgi:hypothetical protein
VRFSILLAVKPAPRHRTFSPKRARSTPDSRAHRPLLLNPISCNVTGMFIRYFVELPISFERAEQVLLRSPATWLPAVARAADDRGESLLTEVGFPLDDHRVEKKVEIEFGEHTRVGGKVLVPLLWRPVSFQRFFPVLDGDLELAPLGERQVQLSVSARYTPPFGSIGQAADRALLHRVAEATVKDFLDRAADRFARLGRSGDVQAPAVTRQEGRRP